MYARTSGTPRLPGGREWSITFPAIFHPFSIPFILLYHDFGVFYEFFEANIVEGVAWCRVFGKWEFTLFMGVFGSIVLALL